jgi:hypothetical protein
MLLSQHARLGDLGLLKNTNVILFPLQLELATSCECQKNLSLTVDTRWRGTSSP